jgi:SH3-like domain-containing protein
VCVLAMLLLAGGCKRGAKLAHGDPAFVDAPQVNLRDRLSAIYNKVGVVKNGERVEILEKSKRFVRVRSARGEEGWMEARHLVGPEVADAFAKLASDNANLPVQGHGATRAELNMHVTPGRETDHFYRLDEGAKVEILKRGMAEKQPKPGSTTASAGVAARSSANKPAASLKTTNGKNAPVSEAVAKAPANSAGADTKPAPPAPPPVLEDWWLVRDAQHHVGWVLARMIDVEVPMEIAQYAEGQRIMATFVLNKLADTADDGQTRQVPQYLTLLNSPKDGTPWDYDQIRVFTWNPKRHRYETAYRERNLFGMFPVTVSHQMFDKEGDLPTFTVRVKDDSSGNVRDKTYKLNQPIVRRVLTQEEQKAEDARKAERLAELRQARDARRARVPALAHPKHRH